LKKLYANHIILQAPIYCKGDTQLDPPITMLLIVFMTLIM